MKITQSVLIPVTSSYADYTLESELVIWPEHRSYAEGDITAVRYETRDSVVYALPGQFQKNKKALVRGLEEIISECAMDSKARIMGGVEGNILPKYVIDAYNASSEEVGLILKGYTTAMKRAPFAKRVKSIIKLAHLALLPTSMTVFGLTLLNRLFLPQATQMLLSLSLMGALTMTSALNHRYEIYGWDAQYISGDRLTILYNEPKIE